MDRHSLAIIVVVFIIESQCGLIDDVIGTVADTTSAVKHDIGSVWSYGSGLIFGQNAKNVTETKADEQRGLISGIVHSVHDKKHSLKERISNVFKDDAAPSDKGFFGNMFDKVKNKVIKIKGFVLGDDVKANPLVVNGTNVINEETKAIREGLNKLFFSNNTRKVHGKVFKDAIMSLKFLLVKEIMTWIRILMKERALLMSGQILKILKLTLIQQQILVNQVIHDYFFIIDYFITRLVKLYCRKILFGLNLIVRKWQSKCICECNYIKNDVT